MSTVPGIEHDCFLSYRHLDDLGPIGAPGQGWVTHFHEALAVRLGEYLGRTPNIWRDPRLDGNDVFPVELNDRVATSAVLVPIVSPGYRFSNWCAREFAVFREHAERAHRWTVGNKLAVMKVVRTPLDADEHQVFPVESLGYWFYESDRQTKKAVRFEPGAPPYNRRLEELAQDLAAFLKRLASVSETPPTVPPSGSIVPPKEVLLALDVFGLDRRPRVIVVSCVAVDQPDELSRRMEQVKTTLALDPAYSSSPAVIDRIRRSGLHYEDDEAWLRDKIADELAILPWDGYVSFADWTYFSSSTQDEVVLALLRGVLFDRLRGLIDTTVQVVLSSRLAQFWQSISDAATTYRKEITAMDAVKVVGTSAIRGGGRTNAAVEVADYLGGVTAARLADPASSAGHRFARVYPNKLRLLHDVRTGIHYSRRNPLPTAWCVSGGGYG